MTIKTLSSVHGGQSVAAPAELTTADFLKIAASHLRELASTGVRDPSLIARLKKYADQADKLRAKLVAGL